LITHDRELADLAADCELRLAGRPGPTWI
jgi:hypothetical protein